MKALRFLFIALLLVNCEDEPNTNLSGTWWFTEPPQPFARRNRLDGSTPAFDILFEVNGRQVTNSDLLINGDPATSTFHSEDHGETADLYFESGDFSLKLLGCKKVNAVIFVNHAEYTISGNTSVYKGISIAPWSD